MPDDNAVQASVVLHLLGRAGGYPRADLSAALPDVGDEQLTVALSSLAEAGVVELGAGGIRMGEAVRRLDELGLITV